VLPTLWDAKRALLIRLRSGASRLRPRHYIDANSMHACKTVKNSDLESPPTLYFLLTYCHVECRSSTQRLSFPSVRTISYLLLSLARQAAATHSLNKPSDKTVGLKLHDMNSRRSNHGPTVSYLRAWNSPFNVPSRAKCNGSESCRGWCNGLLCFEPNVLNMPPALSHRQCHILAQAYNPTQGYLLLGSIVQSS